jgi:TonB-dependent receptor
MTNTRALMSRRAGLLAATAIATLGSGNVRAQVTSAGPQPATQSAPQPPAQPTPSGPVAAPVPAQAATPADTIPAPAAAQPAEGTPSSATNDTSAPAPVPGAETAGGSDIVVTGYRQSLANAAANKRAQTNFTDSIFAEDIGKFPDLNIAESLQRIPGVQLTRDVTGEGSQISVRGLGPSFSKITLNGANIAVASSGPVDASGSNREVDLDLFPTELFTRLTVSKTPTSDLIEGGIAGTVNLVNTRPFDNPGTHVNVGIEGGYSPTRGAISPRGSLIASKTWGDTFGVLIGVAGNSLRYRTDGYETIGYTTANLTNPAVGTCTVATCDRVGLNGAAGGGGFKFPTTVPANTGFGLVAGQPLNVAQTSGLTYQQLSNTYVPRLAREAYLQGQRDRISVLFSTEWRPSDHLHFVMDALYGHAHRTINRLDMDLIGRNSNNIVPIDWSVDDNGVLTKGTLANAQFFLEARPVDEHIDFISVNPSGTYKPTDWLRVDAQVNYNRSVYTVVGNSFIFDTAPNSGLAATYDNSQGTDFPIISTNKNLNDPNLGWVNDSYRIQRARRVTTGKGAHLDVTIGDDHANVKFGYAYDDTSRLIQQYDNSTVAQTVGVAAIPNAAIGQYLAPGPSGLLSQSGQTVGFPAFVQPIYSTLQAAAQTAQLTASAPYSATGTASTPSGFIEEVTNGVYGQLNGEAELLARKIRFNAGIRYFHTDQTVTGPVTVNGAITFQTAVTRYDGFLPSFNAAMDVTDKLVLRVAGSRTVTRANPSLLLPGVTFSDISAQVATQGNPDLKPYYSNNADVGVEYYFSRLGFVSANYFNKDIQGFTQTQQIQAPFSSLGIPLATLSPTQLATGIQNNTQISVNTTVNVGQDLTIRGEEFILQQSLDFLTNKISPALKGFGFNGNYTHINQSSAGSAAVAVGIAPNLYTLGGYYENHGVSVHMNYTWTQSAIAALAPQNNIGLGNYLASHGQLDLAANFTPAFLNKAFQITFNAINITNEPLKQYTGFTNQPFTVYYPGPQYLIGLRARF